MNLQHLKYAVEVEKTGSITQAAENLYMGQPNLSKAIKELEGTLGVVIFKRTSKGVLPTEQGKDFLRYAKSILDQVERMEDLYRSGGDGRLHFSAAVPRASDITHAFAKFLAELDQSQQLDVNFKETNATEAIHSVAERESKLGVIRYQAIHEGYFQNLLEDKAICSRPLWEFTSQLLFSIKYLRDRSFKVPSALKPSSVVLINSISETVLSAFWAAMTVFSGSVLSTIFKPPSG